MYETLNVYLENGLRILMHKIPRIKTMSCGIWIKQGSKYETDETNGLSHLIEHLIVNTSTSSNSEYKKLIDKITLNGVEYNASTTKETTSFYFTGLAAMLPQCIEALSHIAINNLEFNEENVENEKKVVMQEAVSFYSSFNQIIERTSQALWGNLDIGRIIVGNMDNVKNAKLDSIKEIIKNSYTPENAVLVVVGDIDYEKTLMEVEKHFNAWKDNKTREYEEIVNSEPGIYYNSSNGKNSVISVGIRIPKYDPIKKVNVDMISTILGNPGLESRLTQEIRIKRGLAYTINSFVSYYKDKGTLGFTVVCNGNSAKEIVEIIMKELMSVKKHGFTEQEIDMAKKILETKTILSMNNLTYHLKFLGKTYCSDKLFSLENEIRKFQKVKNSALIETMDQYFLDNNLGFAGIGSFNVDEVINSLNFI
ncbi:pitrilysin family protein [Clostridium sp. CTA-19]